MMQFVDSKGKKVLSTLLLTVFVFSSFLTALQIDTGSPVEMAGLSDAVDQSADEPMAFCGTPMYNDPEYLRTMVTYAETERVFTSIDEPMNTAPSAEASSTFLAEMSPAPSLESPSPAAYYFHILCKDVDTEFNPVDPTTTFLPSDSYVYLLMTVTVDSEIRSVWYYRHDDADAWVYYDEIASTPPSPGTWDYWVRQPIAGLSYPRAWRIMVYLDGAHSFNEYFEITNDGWQSVTCEDVNGGLPPPDPVNIKDTFTIGVDPQVYYFLRLYGVAYYNEITDHCHDYWVIWYRPDNTVYWTWGPDGWFDYKDLDPTYDVWASVSVYGSMPLDSGTPTGQWRIETYIDTYYDGGEAWYLLTTTTFTVEPAGGAEVFYYYEYDQLTGTSTQMSVTADYYGQTADGNFEIYYDIDDPHIDSTYLSYVADAAVNSWSQLVPFLSSPYDEDGDGLIEVLIVDLNKYDETIYGGIGGYVQYPDANGLGMVYLDNDLDVWLSWNWLRHVFSHEFTHRIEFSYDVFEEGWIMEGMAQFGGDYAWPFSVLQSEVNVFQSNPDVQLTGDTPIAYYCAAYVFFEYVAEEFGTSAVRTVLERTSVDQGKSAVENAVGVSFDTLFNGFAVKNYANDYAGTANTFEGIDIFAVPIASHTVPPSASGSNGTNLWATDYVSFTTSEPALTISFSGEPGRAHNVTVIKVTGDFASYSVEDIPLTDNQGSIAISDANTYSQIALMATRHEDAYPDASWSYSATSEVQDFTISANPIILTFVRPLSASNTKTSTILVTSINGFSSSVTLSSSWVGTQPDGITCSFNPSSVTPPADGYITSTIAVEVASTTPNGAFILNVTGTSNTLSHSSYMKIVIYSLVNDETTSGVYLVYDNYKHWITNPWAFHSYGFHWEDIKSVSHSEIESYPTKYSLDGANPMPGLLIGDDTTGAVYYLYRGKIYWITSPEAFDGYEFDWGDVTSVSNDITTTFSIGWNLDGTTPLPRDGLLIGDASTGAVYYLYRGKIYWITSPEAFDGYGLQWRSITYLTHSVISTYDVGGYNLDGTKLLPGSLICDVSNGRVYYKYWSWIYWITSPEAFESYGFEWNDIQFLPHSEIVSYTSYDLDGINPCPKDSLLWGDVTTGAVYYLYGGRRYWITNPEAFVGYGFEWDKVVLVSHDVISSLPIGYDLDGVNPLPKSGLLVGDYSTGAIYYLYGGEIYWITSPEAFEAYGFNWESVHLLTHDAIANYDRGYDLDGVNPLPDGFRP